MKQIYNTSILKFNIPIFLNFFLLNLIHIYNKFNTIYINFNKKSVLNLL